MRRRRKLNPITEMRMREHAERVVRHRGTGGRRRKESVYESSVMVEHYGTAMQRRKLKGSLWSYSAHLERQRLHSLLYGEKRTENTKRNKQNRKLRDAKIKLRKRQRTGTTALPVQNHS